MKNDPNRERMRPRARAMGRAFCRALESRCNGKSDAIRALLDHFDRPGPWEDEIIDELLRQEEKT